MGVRISHDLNMIAWPIILVVCNLKMSQLDTLAEMVANLTYGLESIRKQLEENQLETMSRLSLVELSNR